MANWVFTLTEKGEVKKGYNLDLYARADADKEAKSVKLYARASSSTTNPDVTLSGADALCVIGQLNQFYNNTMFPMMQAYMPPPPSFTIADEHEKI